METDEIKYFPESMARAVSVVFHPLFMPLYSMGIIFSAPTLFGYLPIELKRILFMVVMINNVILPVMLMVLFRYRNVISSWTIGERRERTIPLITTTILYLITAYIVLRFPVPLFLKSFFIAAFMISLTATVINFWWKVSVHSIGAGALIALVIVLSLRMYSPLHGYLVAGIFVAGLIMSSRLRLNAHTVAQVWVGVLTGLLGIFMIMLIFK
jgi:hypothetical protein